MLHRHRRCQQEPCAHDCYCARPQEEQCVSAAIISADDNATRRMIFKGRWPDEDDDRIAYNFPDRVEKRGEG